VRVMKLRVMVNLGVSIARVMESACKQRKCESACEESAGKN